MKLIQFLRAAALCSAASLLIISCRKEDNSLTTPNKLDVQTSNEKSFGAVPDNPALIAKVPMIISAEFLEKNRLALSSDPLAFSGTLNSQTFSLTGRPGDRTKPVVSITSPSTGSTVSGTVTIQVSATDNVGVSQVSVAVDGILLATRTTAPYNFTWNTSTVASGTHTITATARDAAGNSSSVSRQVGINTAPSGDVTAPTVSITSPAGGSSFTIGATVSIGVSATDNVGVSSVGFSVDGTLQNTLAAAPYNFSWNTTGVASGTHTLTATARDAAGNTSSFSIVVTVNTTVIPATSLPSNYRLVTPPVANQGSEGSCVAFSTVYTARSIEQYYTNNASSYSLGSNIYSPEYVYNQTKLSSDCGSGSTIVTVLNLLQNQGVCTWQTMPYSSTNGCSILPNATQTAQAMNYKINSYVKMANSDITAIKTRLVGNHAVIIYCTVDQAFTDLQPGTIWSYSTGLPGFSHSLAICGYDDNKQAYLAMNSWGTGWADGGFCWIDYTFFTTATSYYVYSIN